ncbi:MAG: transglutaminase domain-containing protein [Candidatus Jordarchaeum sp.]|uniref:transglutaminase domain-containing protein n=1 Tax=Candidatus Jordarchaeum sp. TaxID=2823881 RepID=UPI00404A31CC
MASRRKTILATALILLLLLSLGGAYFILNNIQNPYVQQALNYLTVSNIRQIYYPWITPITINVNNPSDWYDDMFNITLPNMTIDFPPIDMFDSGLIDPNMVVLVVHPEDPSSPTRYWRLEAYDNYNIDWSKTLSGTYPHNPVDPRPGSGDIYTVYMNASHADTSSDLLPALFANYTIIHESIANGYRITTLQGDLTSFDIERDDYNSIILNGDYKGSGLSTLNYTVTGFPFNLGVIQSNAGYPWQTPPYISNIYTQVPSYLPANSTFMNFVNSIDNSSTVFDTAMSALSRLTGGNYTYNINILLNGGGPPQGEDPVLWFLEGKQGICVHFASAFAMALRELGISARLVVGFVGGEITVDPQLGLVHIIKAIHAHAWAEVWVPTTSGGGEWVQFDPTPGPGQNGTNPDPNVQGAYRLELNATPPIVSRGNQVTIDALLTNATSGAPVSGANVSFYIFNPVTMGRTFLGNDTTDINGSAQRNVIPDDSFRVGPLLFLAEAYNQTISPNIPIATNYTGVLLTGNSKIIDMSATSTAPFLGSNYNLIRNQENVLVQGRLIDPNCTNDSIIGIPNVNIEVYHNGSSSPVASGLTDNNGNFRIYCPGYSLDTIDYIFSANYSGFYLGFQITPPTSTSDSNGIHVYVRPTLSVWANPYTLRKNDTTNITAHLEYDNGTAIQGFQVSIYWDNRTVSGTITHLFSGNTNLSGNVFYTNRAWEREGVVQVFANCSTQNRILGVESSRANIYIYDQGLIMIDYAPDEAAIGTSITVSGRVLGGDGNLKPYAGITIIFTGNNKTLSYPATTDGSVYFSRNIYVSSDFIPNYYVINATSKDQFFNASSTSRIIKIYVGTVIGSSGFGSQSLSDGWLAKQSVESRSVQPSESAYITGVLWDALGYPIPGQTVYVYYGSTPLNSNITMENGEFNITLNSSALSILPVNVLSQLNITYLGDEFHTGSWRITELHVFSYARLIFQSPSIGTIGSNYHIRCTTVDSNGNPIMGRTIDIRWNSTDLVSQNTSGGGTISYVYFIDPAYNTEGNVTVVLTLDTGASNSANVYIRQSSGFGGLAIMMLYALQMGSEAPWLLVIIVLAVIGVIFIICLARKMGPKEEAKAVTPLDLKVRLSELKDLVDAGKFNDAVKYLYTMFTDTVTQYSGLTRAPNETTREFAVMVIKKEGLNPQLVNGLTQLFERARYSNETMDKEDYNKAAKIFAELYSLISGGSLKLA